MLRGAPPLPFFQILSFSCTFQEQLSSIIDLGNPISATVSAQNLVTVTTSVKYVTLTIDLSNHRDCLISVNKSHRSVTYAISEVLHVVTSGFITHVDSLKGNVAVSRFAHSSRNIRHSILKRKCKILTR